MKFGILASNNIYVEETTNGLSNFADISAIVLKSKKEHCNYNHSIDLYLVEKTFIQLLKLPLILEKLSKKVDAFIVHYMNPYFSLLIILGFINKPIVYFCYGGDVRKSKFRNYLTKKALDHVDLIFVEAPSQKKYLHDFFHVPLNRLQSSVIVFPLNPCFKKMDNELHSEIRDKWNIHKKYVIFSPRTLHSHYNHHILLEGIANICEEFKLDIQVVLTGVGNKAYLSDLMNYSHEHNIDLISLNCFLQPEEMAEIYNISIINANIPLHDQFGRSIMEGCMCGSIPLLNSNVPAYHDFLKEGENCFFVDTNPRLIAEKIMFILENHRKYSNLFYQSNYKIFKPYQAVSYIYKNLAEAIGDISLKGE
ncbi:glycosyltransferase [Methanococcoides methylutens]|uniref:Glycosyl transferase family 1 domain-containing protein n=1 Tax=Methanococcoides methylutens MM1 TaxID=1434104 RepID=A0A0E3WYX6_METMT|nr:glycosyltransferase [Methanococcoides methylutens]AKB84294.1 hypothetical protein MCMEM_0241 [Methanococcoides methylutens MM1]